MHLFVSGKIKFESVTFSMNLLKGQGGWERAETHNDPPDSFPTDYNCFPAIPCCRAVKITERGHSLGKRKHFLRIPRVAVPINKFVSTE